MLRVKQGSYKGNGVAHTLIDIGFQPMFVFVKSRSVNFDGGAMWWNGFGSSSFDPTQDAALLTDAIEGVSAGGFTLGDNAKVNRNGEVYYYLAIEDGDTGYIVSDTYTGTGSDQQINTGLDPFDFLIIKRSDGGTSKATYRFANQEPDQCFTWFGDGAISDSITAFDGPEFTVGGDANVNTIDAEYRFFAIKLDGGNENPYGSIGAYNANGTPDTVITAEPGPAPVDFAWVQGLSSHFPVFRTATHDESSQDSIVWGEDLGAQADTITSLTENGFVIGSDALVNSPGQFYYFLVLREPVTTVGIINQKSLTYRIRSKVAKTKSLLYRIRKATAITKSLQYSISSEAVITKSLQYLIAARTAITKALVYVIDPVSTEIPGKSPTVLLTKNEEVPLSTKSDKVELSSVHGKDRVPLG